MKKLCEYDGCHEVVAQGRGHARRYCKDCRCYQRRNAEVKRIAPREVECAYDACHRFRTSHPAARYCQKCRCKAKVDSTRRLIGPRSVSCAYDGCHTWQTTNAQSRYCASCRCRAKAQRRTAQLRREELFEEPQEFRVLRIGRLPDGHRVIIIGDIQMPFHDEATLAAVERFWDDFKPHIEVYNGDIFDLYTVSPFDKNPSRRFRLQDELDLVRSWLTKRVERNPDARRIFIEGNHEDRLRRWLWRHGEELASLRSLSPEELLGLNALGFERLNYMSRLDLLGFQVEHGYRASRSAAYPMNVARYMAIAVGSSGLTNHTHRFSVYSWSDVRGDHTYIENGCLCQLSLEFAAFPNWQHGFTYGVVYGNTLFVSPVRILREGFRAEGEFYPRRR